MDLIDQVVLTDFDTTVTIQGSYRVLGRMNVYECDLLSQRKGAPSYRTLQ